MCHTDPSDGQWHRRITSGARRAYSLSSIYSRPSPVEHCVSNFAVQLTHDGQRTGSCLPTHCSVLTGAKLREGGAVEPRYARAQHLGIRWCASAPRLCRAAHGERERETEDIQRHCNTKTRTAEVTIGIIPESTARSPPTVTELGSVLNGTCAELLPLRSTAHLEVANPCQGDDGKGLEVSSPMKERRIRRAFAASPVRRLYILLTSSVWQMGVKPSGSKRQE